MKKPCNACWHPTCRVVWFTDGYKPGLPLYKGSPLFHTSGVNSWQPNHNAEFENRLTQTHRESLPTKYHEHTVRNAPSPGTCQQASVGRRGGVGVAVLAMGATLIRIQSQQPDPRLAVVPAASAPAAPASGAASAALPMPEPAPGRSIQTRCREHCLCQCQKRKLRLFTKCRQLLKQ